MMEDVAQMLLGEAEEEKGKRITDVEWTWS